MLDLSQRTVGFFVENWPPPMMLAVGIPLGLAWAWTCLHLAGRLKRDLGLRTGYSRKAFHFATFFSVALLHGFVGTPAVCLFGGMTSLVVLYALIRGDSHLLYEAMAREKDAPRRTYYIVVPYFSTLAGGLLSNILFGHRAVVGYLVTGLGDAVGEPVGTRFGRHRYPVPSLRGVKAWRSLEGSAAVLVASALAVALGFWLNPQLAAGPLFWAKLPAVALACALVEAVSPHGLDNLTMQVVPNLLVWLWF